MGRGSLKYAEKKCQHCRGQIAASVRLPGAVPDGVAAPCLRSHPLIGGVAAVVVVVGGGDVDVGVVFGAVGIDCGGGGSFFFSFVSVVSVAANVVVVVVFC